MFGEAQQRVLHDKPNLDRQERHTRRDTEEGEVPSLGAEQPSVGGTEGKKEIKGSYPGSVAGSI